MEWDKARDGSLLAVFRFGKVNPAQVLAQPVKGAQNALKREERAPVPIVTEGETQLQWAGRLSEIYADLPEDVRLRLRDAARVGVEPFFWHRIEAPDSPFSLRLWESVERETK